MPQYLTTEFFTMVSGIIHPIAQGISTFGLVIEITLLRIWTVLNQACIFSSIHLLETLHVR
jgi:hypothetical protein